MLFEKELDELYEGRDVASVTEVSDALDVAPYLVRSTAKIIGVARLGPLLAINRDDASEIADELVAIGAIVECDDDDPDVDPDAEEDDDDDGDDEEG